MTGLETFIRELESSRSDMCDPFVSADTVLPIAQWKIHIVKRSLIELLTARKVVEAARLQVQIAKEAHAEWDRDNESRVGKLLLAMAGHIPGYRPETDAIHAALSAHDAADPQHGAIEG